MEPEEQVTVDPFSLENTENVTKYQTAADIANKALNVVVAAAIEGANLYELCTLGDKYIEDATDKVYNKLKDGKKVHKGIAFPTCVNINGYVCHLSPLSGDIEAKITLKKGDFVKIELGAHVDGFPVSVGCTIVVGASKANPVTGKHADTIAAAHFAAEAAVRLLRPGKTNFDITDTVQKLVVEQFGCVPVEGIISGNVIPKQGEGEKQIILNPQPEQRREVPKFEFALGEVYSIDILVSSGEGKTKVADVRTTIYKKQADVNYSLKMQTSRKFISDVITKFGNLPFNLRNCEDESKARAGVVECLKNRVLTGYPVLESNKGEVVAQFKFTALLMPNGTILKVTNYPYDAEVIKTEKLIVDPELKALVTGSLKAQKPKK